MVTIKQKTFAVFTTGIFCIALSLFFVKTSYFLYLFMFGIWTTLLSGVIWNIFGVQTATPKIGVGKKEQLLSDIKLLIKSS
jgi:hypothetical protein